MKKPRVNFNIAVTGGCNLKCPSCPVGHTPEFKLKPGLMSAEVLDKILTKAKLECEVTYIGLFHATEPLLHPNLADLVRVVKRHDLRCAISSNLNINRNYQEIMDAEPDAFIVSVSGFEQTNYEYTHRGGDIERVKANMSDLAAAWARAGRKCYLRLTFHRYLGNVDDELKMRAFAEKLGFEFCPIWAHFLSLDKLVRFIDSGYDLDSFNEDDRKLVDRLAVPMKEVATLYNKEKARECFLIEGDLALDIEGNVTHCSEDGSSAIVGNYLDLPISQIQSRKRGSDVCKKCKPTGAHNFFNAVCDGDNNPDLATEIDSLSRQRLITSYFGKDDKNVSLVDLRAKRELVGELKERLYRLTDSIDIAESLLKNPKFRDFDCLQTVLIKTNKEVEHLKEGLKTTKSKIILTEERIASVQTQVENIKKSRSWKVTHGLRVLSSRTKS